MRRAFKIFILKPYEIDVIIKADYFRIDGGAIIFYERTTPVKGFDTIVACYGPTLWGSFKEITE